MGVYLSGKNLLEGSHLILKRLNQLVPECLDETLVGDPVPGWRQQDHGTEQGHLGGARRRVHKRTRKCNERIDEINLKHGDDNFSTGERLSI